MSKHEDRKKVEVYYLSNFTKIQRKIYGVGGKVLPQPVYIKTTVFFLATLVILILLRFLPITGFLLGWIPPVIYYAFLPGLLAYLLKEWNEEDRSFLSYFRSLTKYQKRQKQNIAYYHGRPIKIYDKDTKVK